jgi:hypothetical protein
MRWCRKKYAHCTYMFFQTFILSLSPSSWYKIVSTSLVNLHIISWGLVHLFFLCIFLPKSLAKIANLLRAMQIDQIQTRSKFIITWWIWVWSIFFCNKPLKYAKFSHPNFGTKCKRECYISVPLLQNSKGVR